MSIYENYEICKSCGGACCRSNGCAISVRQIKNFNKETLKKLISTGIIVMDYYYASDFGTIPDYIDYLYYLRIRTISDKKHNTSVSGDCIIRHRFGRCMIPIEYRPYEAAYMIPNKDRISEDLNIRFHAYCDGPEDTSTKAIALEYLPYNAMMEEFIDEEGYNLMDLSYVNYLDSITKLGELIKVNEDFT